MPTSHVGKLFSNGAISFYEWEVRTRSHRCVHAVKRNRGAHPFSRTRQVSLPVANAPVSILMRLGRTSGHSTGECPWTTIFPKLIVLVRNSSRIHKRSSTF